MNTIIFFAFVLFFGLTIWGRRLREEAFRALSAEQRANIADKLPNYSSTEMIPFAALLLSLLGVGLFRPEWLRRGVAVCIPLIVFLVSMFHVRARHRVRAVDLPEAFLVRYERSRIVTYSALALLIGAMVWMLYL